jgi:hypothetical protein
MRPQRDDFIHEVTMSESSTIGKGKRKVAPARAKVYAPMDELVSSVTCGRVSVLTYLLTV